MDLNNFFEEQSKLYNDERLSEMPDFFDGWLKKAEEEGDKGASVTILNEMMGFYREKSLHDKAISCGIEAERLMKELGMEGTVPYAMTLLNAATVYRAAGKYQESAEKYAEVFAIFHDTLPPNDFKFAEANNNVALLYQELERYDKAAEALERALSICRDTPHKEFETAVTLANLGNCEIKLGELGAALVDLTEATEIFNEEGASDTHHAAAIMGLADIEVLLGHKEKAAEGYQKALAMIEGYIGKNDDYRRVEEKLQVTEKNNQNNIPDKETDDNPDKNRDNIRETGFGLRLARHFYDTLGSRMIRGKFPQYEARIAVGKAGSGSECFGFDDIYSRDHDFGPGFSMWLTDEDYNEIGEALSSEYEKILEEYISGKYYEELLASEDFSDNNENIAADGITGDNESKPEVDNDAAARQIIQSEYRDERAKGRTGVKKISDFYLEHTGCPEGPKTYAEYLGAEEAGLAAAVNGEIYRDDAGVFTAIRERLKAYYPEYVRFLKIANLFTMLGREAQYNFGRASSRKDYTAAALMRDSAVRDALQLIYLLNDTYAPHEKWLRKGIDGLKHIAYVGRLIDDIELADLRDTKRIERYLEKLCFTVLREVKDQGIVWGNSTFLPDYSAMFNRKAEIYMMDIPTLAGEIAKVEFRAFDSVNNEGGRAECQNNWPTFRIMRMSQYLTWTKEMLVQYLTDFEGVIAEGRNMITEKYGYMMETTAPNEFKRIKDKLPPVPESKRVLVRELTKIETGWMEEFAEKYPNLSQNARLIHTNEDIGWNTSSETYQRGELYSYSDKMLLMYGRFIAGLCKMGINLTMKIMENTVKMYGYKNLDDAEEKSKK
ncbi:Tetratricopeptide repeat-containing protein [Eubacterium ruminantium]|nr:Tetratricopeptide repeat-containing protein [Eubacterium ruminantium]